MSQSYHPIRGLGFKASVQSAEIKASRWLKIDAQRSRTLKQMAVRFDLRPNFWTVHFHVFRMHPSFKSATLKVDKNAFAK